MEKHRVHGIVLGLMDYREADRLVTVLSRENGKIRGIARGGKRSVRRFGGALELFARLQLELSPHPGLVQLLTADVETVFPAIRRDLIKIALASYACELIDALVPEAVPYPRLFRLLSAYLEQLDRHPPSPSDRRFFEINLLNILGYRPQLEECCRCGTGLDSAQRVEIAGSEGLLCRRCGTGGRPMAGETIQLLRRALTVGQFGAVAFPPAGVAEAGLFLEPYLSAHLQRPLKSLEFLREMER